ncbi:LacI family transcription regulator [Marinomonas ushuaiensis DSM 15871]|uniref:LacI family transcription regulator n=1 Tax=Marinomonas ushuaiensis DSM 15871 TaxID=1122207 RepID=X7E8G5_9GAMM|nr:LacI family DNA-binding transcriptional regulator [Marinomonas ushuaiensis]ETX12257.1 LacI family transcription regulator [Marinomonas ushuaiensis DSM 15871]
MSIKEIATQLDLSVSTVSRALNDYPDISRSTKKRVCKEAERQGYQLKGADAAHWVQTKRVITAIVSSQDTQYLDPILSKVLAGARQALQAEGYLLQVVAIDTGKQELSEFERFIKAGDQDGFLLLRTRANDPKVHRLLKLNVPFVCYGRTERATQFAWLDLDNYQVGHLSLTHLYEQGHRHIGIVSVNERYFFAQERKRGIQDAAKELGLELSTEHCLEVGFDEEDTYLACAEFLLLHPDITALICLTSTSARSAALAVMRLSHSRQNNADHKISVIGCDTPMDELTATMGITSIQQAPPAQIGEQLAKMMMLRIKGTAVKDLQVILAPGVVTNGFSNSLKAR